MQVSNKPITIKNIIYIFLPLLLAITIQYVTVFADVLIIFFTNLLSDETTESTRTISEIMSQAFEQPMNQAYISLAQYVLYLIFFGLWYYRGFCNTTSDGINSSKDKITLTGVVLSSFKRGIRSITRLISLIIAGISGQFLVDSILALARPIFVQAFEEYDKLVANVTGASASFVMWFTVIVIAPIAEEILFRGLILKYSGKCLLTPLAIIFQAVLFGLYHGNVIQGLYAFVLGSVLGVIACSSGSLIPGMIFHIALNASLLIVPELLFNTPTSTIVTGVVSLIIFFICIFGILFRTNKNKNII